MRSIIEGILFVVMSLAMLLFSMTLGALALVIISLNYLP